MANSFSLTAASRTDLGKGASRRLRREALIPAIVYGGDNEPVPVTLKANEMARNLLEEAFYASLVTLNLDDTKETVILRDLHRHPYKNIILHADFQRVNAKEELTVMAPLHFINEETSKGVKMGGMVSHIMTEIEISCLPENIPEYIEIDIENLDLHDSIHLSEIVFPEGVLPTLLKVEDGAEASEHGSLPVVSIVETRGGGSSDSGDESAADSNEETTD